MVTAISAMNTSVVTPMNVTANKSSQPKQASTTRLNSAKGRNVAQHASKWITVPLITAAVIGLGIPTGIGALNMLRSDGNGEHWATNGQQLKDGFAGTYAAYDYVLGGFGGFASGVSPDAAKAFLGTEGGTYQAHTGTSAASQALAFGGGNTAATTNSGPQVIIPQNGVALTVGENETAIQLYTRLTQTLGTDYNINVGKSSPALQKALQHNLVQAMFKDGVPIAVNTGFSDSTLGMGGSTGTFEKAAQNLRARLIQLGVSKNPPMAQVNAILKAGLEAQQGGLGFGQTAAADVTKQAFNQEVIVIKPPMSAFGNTPEASLLLLASNANYPFAQHFKGQEVVTHVPANIADSQAQVAQVAPPANNPAAQNTLTLEPAAAQQAPASSAAQTAPAGNIQIQMKATGGGLASLDKCMPDKTFKGQNRKQAGPTLATMNPNINFGQLVKNQWYTVNLPKGWEGRLSLTNNPNCKKAK